MSDLLQIYGTSAVKTIHPCIVLTTSFASPRNIASVETSGVHAASANNPQRIRTDRDVRGSNQQRVCTANT